MQSSSSDLTASHSTVRRRSSRRTVVVLCASLLILVICSLAALCIGPVGLSPAVVTGAVIHGPQTSGLSEAQAESTTIIWQVRLPRIVLSILIGAGLAAAGTAFQSLLRNPLADPYILGVSAGASLAASLVIVLGMELALAGFALPIAAFAGALATLLLVAGLSNTGVKIDIKSMLLSGVVVNAFLWSVQLGMLRLNGKSTDEILAWLMGRLSGASWQQDALLAPMILAGAGFLMLQTPSMNLYALGEESARQLGLDADAFKRRLVFAATLLTSATVALTGIIGFVGLASPHIARKLLYTSDHRRVLPLSAVCGAVLMVFADTMARTALGGDAVPVGVVTAFLGAPFFFYLLKTTRTR